MLREYRCHECHDLEQAHDQAMEQYINLVDQQSAFFGRRQVLAGRDMDAALRQAKSRREAAIDALLNHQVLHRNDRTISRDK